MSRSRIIAATTLGLLLASTRAVGAQATDSTLATRNSRWEVLSSSGALVPTGAQRSAMKRAALTTAQVLYVVGPHLAVTTTLGWGRSRDLVAEGTSKLSVFTYDVGLEARGPQWRQQSALALTPFAGLGAGGRSYDHRGRDVDATHDIAAYASLGAELGAGRVRLRLEGRDYLSRFSPVTGGGRATARQDFTLLVGLRLTRKRAVE